MKNEVWKPVLGYEGIYEASNQGNIRSLKFGKVRELRAGVVRGGYLMVVLCKDSTQRSMRVHRIVYEAFCGKIPEGLTVNHKNEVKTDNRIDNLELMTLEENLRYGTHDARSAMSRRYCDRKGTCNERKAVYCLTNSHYYNSTMEASRTLGVNMGNISKCCAGKYSQTGGYEFRYAVPEEARLMRNLQRLLGKCTNVFDYADLNALEREVRSAERSIVLHKKSAKIV